MKLALFVALSLVGANAASLRRHQCPDRLNRATSIANELQLQYWNGFIGSYTDGELWTDANTLEDLHNLMIATGTDTYADIADSSYIGRAVLNPFQDWDLFFGGSYDDAQWVILALWKICDYRISRGVEYDEYMSSSLGIYDIVAVQWDDTCGGGVWWSSDHTYKNAITNELFLLTSAQAYLRTGDDTYLQNALRTYDWLLNSGMRGPDGLFNDGLDFNTCKNNRATTWTYNQAVIASGLGALYVADRWNETFLQQAQVSLDATISSSLTDGCVLKESCDGVRPGGTQCDQDQQLFKGIWMKHVQYFLDFANDASITAKYSTFLGSQYAAIVHNALNDTNGVGSVWYSPDKGLSEWGPQASASGLEAVISAAKYAPCNSI